MAECHSLAQDTLLVARQARPDYKNPHLEDAPASCKRNLRPDAGGLERPPASWIFEQRISSRLRVLDMFPIWMKEIPRPTSMPALKIASRRKLVNDSRRGVSSYLLTKLST